MQIYTSLDNLSLKNSCVAIGIFDGVHRGHQEILRQTRASAKAPSEGLSIAMTFDPNPIEVLAPTRAPHYICSVGQRLEWIDSLCGVDAALVIPFDRTFARLLPLEFVENVLVRCLGTRQILVGADFRYGRDRQGSVMDLEAAGQTHGFEVTIVHPISEDGERVSSTRVRSLVGEGQVEAANHLLGHRFTLRGRVVDGKRLGRTLGFPTANLSLEQPRQLLPLAGVYAGHALIHENGAFPTKRRLPAAISVGTNPTTDGEGAPISVEAFLMNGFDSDLHGATLAIEFAGLIRPVAKFDSLDALVAQMHRDVEQIAMVLAGEGA
ncbi:MAG TPA: bifunctional riboflavin kinase/FAD synthetase [Capsulimonadaceae bacterium]|nr:bifunctional riboflavin kinase/FAD synthetase [Capsulimonadaceae bacterium]